MATTTSATAAPTSRDRLSAGPQDLSARGGKSDGTSTEGPRALGVPKSGTYTFLIQLETASTVGAFEANRAAGTAVAKEAAKSQLGRVTRAQNAVVAALPPRTPVLYRTHSALAAVAVRTDVSNLDSLKAINGVKAVYPVAPKKLENASAVPLQGAPAVWNGANGYTGKGTTIAVIDTGLDYTHADFGGPGTVAAYEAASAAEKLPADPKLFGPGNKIVGGYDFVGDAYDANDPASVAVPDPNPLDCNGHGSHVGGSAAGLGVNADGSTYRGDYSSTTPFDQLRIGPGMAPGASLLAYRVFGCEGSTNVVAAAIDRATDPNQDGDPSDRVDVINMSLGSDYGNPVDGDTIVANAAADLGVVVAISAGNSYDLYDVGGSPGSATKAITSAASVDAGNVVDALNVTIGGAKKTYAASRSVAYDWRSKPDLSGPVVAAQLPNDTACSAYPAGTFTGKVVLVKWTQENLECGSVTRSANLVAAGAVGFILANSAETFSAGITGSAVIPGVLVAKSGGEAIRAALAVPTAVTADSTEANAVTQTVPGDVDKLSDFSSRGGRGNGSLKPDVAAVGASVFSAASGTGNEGITESGTSMASPMTAGLAALVRSKHPKWTAEMVKADIMNTAGQNLYVDGSAAKTGGRYAPNRVGAGRIQAVPALANEVLAYVKDDAGAVSVSFGPVEVSGPMSITKTVTVQNTGTTAQQLTTGYDEITAVPGVSYDIAPATVQVSAGGTSEVSVRFTVTDPTLLTKTVDGTHGRIDPGTGFPLETLADASGNLTLTPTQNGPSLRVPIYSAPRPVSSMTQPATLSFPTDGSNQAPLTLSGTGLDQGTGAASIFSVAAGLELTAISGQAPTCTTTVTDRCVSGPNDRPADLKYVGTALDDTGVKAADRMLYFGITGQAPASTPAGKTEFDVYLDVDNDLVPDLVAYNTRLPDTEIFVTNLVDLATGKVVDTELLNNRFGDLDLAVFDSDTMLMPVLLDVLAGYGVDADNPRINYGIQSFSSSAPQLVDAVGFDADAVKLSGDLSTDVSTPGLSVTSGGQGPLFEDQPGTTLTVTRNVKAYAEDNALGVMMVHFHNSAGNKAQIVQTGIRSATTLSAAPAAVTLGSPTTLTVDVNQAGGSGAPVGEVSVIDTTKNEEVASGTTDPSGTLVLPYTPTEVGVTSLKALFLGNASYAPSGSSLATVTATAVTTPPTTPPAPPTIPPTVPPTVPAKMAPDLDVKLTFKRGRAGSKTSVKVDLTDSGAAVATGKVKLRVNGKSVTTRSLRAGKIAFSLRPRQTSKIRVIYQGDAVYTKARSRRLTYRVI